MKNHSNAMKYIIVTVMVLLCLYNLKLTLGLKEEMRDLKTNVVRVECRDGWHRTFTTLAGFERPFHAFGCLKNPVN